MSSELNALICPLKGINLIEANAGTGKTYNITALTARMICELDFPVEKILVVTFTKAAVSELKAKIYDRLLNLREGLINNTHEDKFISSYISQCIDKPTAIKRLSTAIRDFDMSSVMTIHSFCQKMLTENSFSGRIAYDTEMTGAPKELLLRPVQDFWRKYIYPLPDFAARLFANDTPENLTRLLDSLFNKPSAVFLKPDDVSLSGLKEKSDALLTAFRDLKEIEEAQYDIVFSLIFPDRTKSVLNNSKYKPENFLNVIKSLRTLLELNQPDYKEKHNGRNFHITLTKSYVDSAKTKTSPDVSHPLFDAAERWATAYNEYAQASYAFRKNMILRLKDYADSVLDDYKLRINSQSYNDLISRMHKAVTRKDSGMSESLVKKYAAVLIDEFQDTDDRQYEIFHESFGKAGKPFFMIGDPKQAIYSFRGADIYTYFKASAECAPMTLTTNHRSDKLLVEAVNSLFKMENPFLMENLDFIFSTGKIDMPVYEGTQRLKPMTIWHVKDISPETVSLATARRIAQLLNNRAEITDNNIKRQIKPSDIAVLVRDKNQAKHVRACLEKCSVPSVISGSQNVFDSFQALEMAKFIYACIFFTNEEAVRTALATDIFGCTAEQIFMLLESDSTDSVFEDFAEYAALLEQKGIASAFMRAAEKNHLFSRLAATVTGERKLTNFMHLAELAQKYESQKKASLNELYQWFIARINESQERSDEYELKMDSDENAVTITTIHKSKGLEYPVVFAPFLMFAKKSFKSDYITFHNEEKQLVCDFRKDDSANEKSAEEALAEDIRLTYVALTRAKAVCFTAWGAVSKGYSSKATAFRRMFCKDMNNFSDDDFLVAVADCPHIEVCELPVPAVLRYAAEQDKISSPNLIFSSEIARPWKISSFSGLIHSRYGAKDTEQAVPYEHKPSETFDIFSFPKGAGPGSCLHEIMENIIFENPAAEQIKQVTLEYLAKYNISAEFSDAVSENIMSVLNKELLPGIKLSGLKDTDFITEMEFHIKTGNFTSDIIAAIISQHGDKDFATACSVLDFVAEKGFLTGFADLIFKRGGKFYILDWKSNHLGSTPEYYSNQRMRDEMINSHYYLQLYFYTLALHLHLSHTLPGYDYDTDIGGGLYIFMRGVLPQGDTGIFYHKPDRNIILKMAAAAGAE